MDEFIHHRIHMTAKSRSSELFVSPERERMKKEPIVRFSRMEKVTNPKTHEIKDVSKKYVAIAGVELEVYEGPNGSVFSDDEFLDFSFDEASVDLLKRFATAAKLHQPILIEGETDIGKTRSLEYLAHLTNHRLFRLSLSGQTDVSEFIGKYVPNTQDAKATFENLLRVREKLSLSSQAILEKADEELRGLTEDECKVIAKNEGMAIGEHVNWIWQDGIIIKAMTYNKGRGTWLYLDEIGATEPQILVKINRIFEKFGRLELAENGNRMVEAGEDFRLFASTTPPEYAGRLPFALDFLRRFVYQKIGSLDKKTVSDRLSFLFGMKIEQEEVREILEKIGVREGSALDLNNEPKLSKVIVEFLTELFQQLKAAIENGEIGRQQKQQFRYEFSDLMRVKTFLSAFGGKNPESTLREALEFYFVNKLGAETDRVRVRQIITTIFTAKNTSEKMKKAWEKKPEEMVEETPEERTAREEAERAIADLENETPPSNLNELLQSLSSELQNHLNTRLASSGSSETLTLHPEHISLPESLTKEHLEAVKEALGGTGFEERLLPTLEDLHNLSDAYVNAMYPETQSEADTARGLTAYRPSWWNNAVSIEGKVFTVHNTWGKAYLHSMRKELEQLGGSLVLLDTATKPTYIDGSQHYGTKEGTDATHDPLLPLFQEAFGSEANRFNHTWDDLQTTLLPLATTKIKDLFRTKGLPDIPFQVILTPAILDNQHMTFYDPASSSTNTWEWTSTPLIDDARADTGRRLDVGDSDHGGAGSAVRGGRGNGDGTLGARLAVVFQSRD